MMMHTLINRVIYFSFSSNDLHGQAYLKKLDRVMIIFLHIKEAVNQAFHSLLLLYLIVKSYL